MAHSTVQTAQPFIGPDFLLDGEHARKLFHEVADELPIIDYHSHLHPVDIRETGNLPIFMNCGWRGIITSGGRCVPME